MIKGLAITPPVLGRISIGRVVERAGKRVPEKDDQFTITSQVQKKDGWVAHPFDETLRKGANDKIRSIPVRMMFNDPDLNFRAEYSMFDRTNGRLVCSGDGETCRRYVEGEMQELPCPSPDMCSFGMGGLCKPYGRLNVLIGEEDELGSFIFRTTGFNSIRTLTARLNYYRAVSGNLLSCLPLELKLRGKSTTQSHRAAIFYVDLSVREGMRLEDAITEARATHDRRKQCGHDQDALDEAAKTGFANGAFEDAADEMPAVLEEFYSESGEAGGSATVTGNPATNESLKEKLDRKAGPTA